MAYRFNPIRDEHFLLSYNEFQLHVARVEIFRGSREVGAPLAEDLEATSKMQASYSQAVASVLSLLSLFIQHCLSSLLNWLQLYACELPAQKL